MSWIKENKLKFLAIILFFIILGIITIYLVNDNFSAIRNDPFSTSKINILIAGYDSSINGPPRADTIMLASIDMDSNDIGVLFIPRDTRVEIPAYGKEKINASHAYGGIELTTKTLENFLDIPIDYYVETDFNGFTDIIDSIGGVNLHIEKPLYYVDKAGGVNIDLPAGDVHLNGEESLDYVRYRGRIKGDIGRVERQQKFVKAVIDKFLSPEIIIKAPKIYNNLIKSVNTNIPIKDVTPFLKVLKNMDLNNLETEMLPGKPKYINDVSYWLADRDELNILVDNLIRSKEYIKNKKYDLIIYNGNGKSGLAREAADSLEK
ncbi:MAG: LCP family protein, partial [archaeon]